jgi:hypothetical protein
MNTKLNQLTPMHVLDLLLLTIGVAALALATSALIARGMPARGVRRPPSNNFEGILINHEGQVRRVAPAYPPHANPFKSSNLFQQKGTMS